MLAVAMNQVSQTFAREGRFDSAEVHLRRSMEMRVRLEGPEDPDVARLHHTLGDLQRLQGQGHFVAAERSLREAVRQNELFWGPDAAISLRSQAVLAGVLAELGMLEEAEELLRRATAVQREVLGQPHEDLARSWRFLARVLRLGGEWEEAHVAYQEALLIARTGRAPEDPVRTGAAEDLITFYHEWGRPDEADRILREEEGVARPGGR